MAERIVAELGRAETPAETAARKAESSRVYRSSQSFRNLLAALLVTVGVVAVVVLGVPRGSLPDPEPVDVAAAAQAASDRLGAPVLSPEAPEGWRANSARMVDGVWRIVYAPTEGFVRISQGFGVADDWPGASLGNFAPTGTESVGGIVWDRFELPGTDASANISYALATRAGSDIVLIASSTGADAARTAAEAVAGDVRALTEGAE
jgi:hypothetical protein